MAGGEADVSRAFWFAGTDVYARTLGAYGSRSLPADTDRRVRQAVDLMCGVAYGVRASMFESRKANRVLPGTNNFSDAAVAALTAIAVSVAVPSMAAWIGSPELFTSGATAVLRRELRSALPGTEGNLERLERGDRLAQGDLLRNAARQFVGVAERDRKKVQYGEREIAEIVFPSALRKARTTLRHDGTSFEDILAALKSKAGPPHAGGSTGGPERGALGLAILLDRTIDLMKLYRFRSFGMAERIAELDGAISDDGLHDDWEDAFVRDIVSTALGGTDGRQFTLSDRLLLGGVFTAATRLGEHVFKQPIPVGRSGEFDRSLTAGKALQLTQYADTDVVEFIRAVPEMTTWLTWAVVAAAASSSEVGKSAFEQAAARAMLAGVLWVAQHSA